MIKTTPMIFNTEMVRALLAGNKTQTRRPVADWQLPKDTSPQEGYDNLKYMSVAQRGRYGFGVFGATAEEAMSNYNGEYSGINPFGKDGTLIYVRETFSFAENHFNDISGQYSIGYKADEACSLINPTVDNNDYMANLALKKGNTPSIHMPRWASRLTLKINSVRVERIQDISEEDAIAEGFDYSKSESAAKQGFAISARTNFRHAWESIYGDSWNKNQWVWVIDFEVIHKNIDLVLAEMEQTS